jgi:hypothetical protein
MPTIEIKVQRISFISDSPFDEIVKTLTATIGCPDTMSKSMVTQRAHTTSMITKSYLAS